MVFFVIWFEIEKKIMVYEHYHHPLTIIKFSKRQKDKTSRLATSLKQLYVRDIGKFLVETKNGPARRF